VAIEVVSTNWQDDYQTKAQLYAEFGIFEYWIFDFLLTLDNHPFFRNPDIKEPTISIGLLRGKSDQWQRYTGNNRIVSSVFPQLNLPVNLALD